MKQTAVEWLRQELLKRDMDISIKDLFEQAKEIEKEQIMEAHMDGALNTIWDENTDRDENASDYYYETFKNTDQ
jgi:hypothetical protein